MATSPRYHVANIAGGRSTWSSLERAMAAAEDWGNECGVYSARTGRLLWLMEPDEDGDLVWRRLSRTEPAGEGN